MKEPSAEETFILPQGSKETTFSSDNQLPSLPLPPLSESLGKYLESVKPFVTSEEFENTRRIVEKFKNGDGKILNLKLQEKAKRERNWVENWWYEWAYLRVRAPLIPYCSMDGVFPVDIPGWKYTDEDDQIAHAATVMHAMFEFWQLLRKEKLKPGQAVDNTPFSMSQFRNLFNTVRLPGEEVDTIVSHFKAENEGDCPSDAIILCRGRIFRFNCLDSQGNLLNPPEIGSIFKRVLRICEGKPAEFPVPSLTCDDRSRWSQNYAKLNTISPRNAANLKIIESAINVVCLDDDMPETDTQVSNCNLCGNLNSRWADKSTANIFYRNGRIGGVCDHTAFDGIVSISMNHYVYLKVCENMGGWNGRMDVRQDVVHVEEVHFDLNDELKAEIRRFAIDGAKNKQEITMFRDHFNKFGKTKIRKYKLHPDAFVQMSLQLAYYKIHMKPAPCYETATTRSFYNGRTETVRSCTQQCIDWVAAMHTRSIPNPMKKDLLVKALDKHNKLMNECRQNAGCDRHLFGLYCTALEEGLPIPDIYSDPAYSKSGGGGNFILSTSLTGYTPIGGGVAPMHIDGYGVFYSIIPDKISVTISTNSLSDQTDPQKFFNVWSQSLCEMIALWETAPTSKL